jgi:hypothetical protein
MSSREAPHPAQSTTYFVPALTSGDADSYFSDAISYAATNGYGKVVCPKDSYNFSNTWEEDNLTDLTIDLQGSTLNFSADGYGLLFNGATRVALQNFTVDFPTLTLAATATIIEGSNGNRAIKIDAGFPIDGSSPPAILAADVWDRANNIFARPQNPDYLPTNPQLDYSYAGNQIYLSSTTSSISVRVQ